MPARLLALYNQTHRRLDETMTFWRLHPPTCYTRIRDCSFGTGTPHPPRFFRRLEYDCWGWLFILSSLSVLPDSPCERLFVHSSNRLVAAPKPDPPSSGIQLNDQWEAAAGLEGVEWERGRDGVLCTTIQPKSSYSDQGCLVQKYIADMGRTVGQSL